MREDDLDQGLQNIKDILVRLESRAFDAELLKDFPRPVHAQTPETITPEPPQKPAEATPESPASELPVVQQTAEPAPASGPENRTETLPELPAGLPAEATASEPPTVRQTIEEPPVIEPEPEVLKTDVPPGPPAEAPRPEPAPVQQTSEQPPPGEPEKAAVKKAAGSRATTLALFGLGLILAAAVYQFGFNGGRYRLRQAARLEQIGDTAKALAAYERLVLKYPDSAEAAAGQYAVGNIKAGRGDLPGAVESYEKFLRMSRAGDSKIPEAKFRLAELRFNAGDFFVAGNLYSAADVLASRFSQQAQERLGQIRTVEARAAAAKKLIAADPARAAEEYSAILAAYPGYAEAQAGLEEARKRQANPVKPAPRASDQAKAAAAAKAKLARSILAANRKHLGAPAPSKAKSLKTFSLADRFAACTPVWQAEKAQAGPEAGLLSVNNKYDCGALKDNMATCGKFRENTRAIQAESAEVRAARAQSAVKGWTVEKQESLDKKMLKLYEENRCAELLDLAAQSEEEEAPEGF